MANPILLTKVTLPHRNNHLLTRQRLVEIVEESLDRKLTVVVAPAGYGKTSLLIDVAHRHEFPFCWYSQDQTDADLSSFLEHLIACIELRFSQFGEQSRAALLAFNHGNLSPEHCETVIVNEIYNTIVEHFVIVLDDYHLIQDNLDINQFINRFLQDVDQNCHVVVLSRVLLALLDLPLMLAQGQASGIGLQELAFRPDEIKSLLMQNYHQVISDAMAQELAQKTDGWITGLLLTAQTMWRGVQWHLNTQGPSNTPLYDYLANQVLDQQSPELRDFLLQTACVEEFNAELCQELLGQPPANQTWQAMLERVLAKNLFVLLVEKDGFWLRYHHLFRDFLQNRLRLENPQQASLLQNSLLEIYTRRQEWQKAYAICLNLGDLETTGAFLEHAGESMVRSGRMPLLRNWLEALPAGFIGERPALLAILGIVLATLGNAERGLGPLNQAVHRYREQQNHKSLAGVLVWRALVHYLQGKWEDSLADAQEVLGLTQQAEGNESLTRFRAEAYRILGQNNRLQGNIQQSIDNLSQALDLYRAQQDASGFNLVQVSLGASYFESGEFSSALSCYQQALEYHQTQGELFLEAAVLNDLAVLHHINGEYLEAFSTFEQARNTARHGSNTRVEAMVLLGLGDLFVDLDAPDSALEAYRQARDRVEHSKYHFLNIYQHIAEASASRLQRDFARARDLMQAAEQLIVPATLNYTHGLWLLESGQLALAENHHAQAREQFTRAAFLFEAGGQRILAGRANLLLGAALFALHKSQEAEIYLEKAFQTVSGLESQQVLVCAARQARLLLAFPDLSPGIRELARRLLERVKLFETNLPSLNRTLRFQKMEIPISPPLLEIQALGDARVLLDGKPVTITDWQSKITRDLLFIILCRPHGWSKEVLGEILWPGSTPAQLNNRFKNTIYRLRRALRQDVILFDGERYVFNKNLDYSYDVERFDQLLAQTKAGKDKQVRKQSYQELFQLYQGDYLPEFEGIWALPEREHLRQAFLAAGLQLATLYIEDLQHQQALEVCQRLINADVCLEKAYCLAMQALAAVGDRAGVARFYEKLQANLEAEIGIAPSAQTSALFRSLIR